jgi:hypothetical protein
MMREKETMEHCLNAGPGPIYLVLLVAVAIIVSSGCTDTAVGQRGPAVPPAGMPPFLPAEETVAITTQTVAVPTASPAVSPEPVSIPCAIAFDPLGEKKAGESFDITGTTTLPAGTNLFWSITPDSGKVPTGIDITDPVGIMANNQVRGTGTTNTVLLSVDGESTRELPKGKYVIVVVSLKENPMTTNPSTGILAGYNYLTLT